MKNGTFFRNALQQVLAFNFLKLSIVKKLHSNTTPYFFVEIFLCKSPVIWPRHQSCWWSREDEGEFDSGAETTLSDQEGETRIRGGLVIVFVVFKKYYSGHP